MSDSNNIKKKINQYKKETCSSIGFVSQQTIIPPTCKITELQIINMSLFIANIITKCTQTEITLDDIKDAIKKDTDCRQKREDPFADLTSSHKIYEIISRGSFGYTMKIGNDKHKIIKIIDDIKTGPL